MEGRQASSHFDPYIRIPSDLFGEGRNHCAPFVFLPFSLNGRTAGVYPPARPLPLPLPQPQFRPQPWSLQGRGRKIVKAFPLPALLTSRRRFRTSELAGSVTDRSHDRCRRHRRHGYREAGVWQQQQSVPRPFSLTHPLIRRQGR